LVIANLSNKETAFDLEANAGFNDLKEYFSGAKFKGNSFKLKPWEYRVYVKP
jgi:hypothetical protein